MNSFSAGDIVLIEKNGDSRFEDGFEGDSRIQHGVCPKGPEQEGVVVDGPSKGRYLVTYKVGERQMTLSFSEDRLVLIVRSQPHNLSFKPFTFMENLIQSYKNYMKPEPFKSFQKAGVTDQNDELTAQGKDLFLSYLLEKHGKEFKENVVDKLVEASEKASK